MKRYKNNPLITRDSLASENPELKNISSVFNPGAVKFNDKYLLLLRVQNRGRRTFIIPAISEDGLNFAINPEPVIFNDLNLISDSIYHIYDPRITQIEDQYYVTVAIDCDSTTVSAIFTTDDFNSFQFVSCLSDIQGRNAVLFPEKINDFYYLLIRPNNTKNSGISSGNTIELFKSNDMESWQNCGSLFSGRAHYWDELIGAGPPPIKTKAGWLLIYHGIATHFQAVNIYQAGVALLDLKDPLKVLARSSQNILEPRELYELTGQVPNVVFPSGAIVDKYDQDNFAALDSPVKIYYGAADTSVCLAESTINQLIEYANE